MNAIEENLTEEQCLCRTCGGVFESEESFDAHLTKREPTGGDLDLSFERDGFQLTNSGYDTRLNSRGDATAGNPISRHKYYAVYREGEEKPTDLVREQPSGKYISIPDTIAERKRDKRAGWQFSAFKWSEDTDKDWVEHTFEEVQTMLSGGLKDFQRGKRTVSKRKSYDADKKRQVIEKRKTGSSWTAIKNHYGVPIATAQRWVEAAEESDEDS